MVKFILLTESIEMIDILTLCGLYCRQRIPSKNVFYYRSPEHNKNYVLSFAFAFDKENDVYQFAYSYPYSYTRLQTYLSQLDQSDLPHYSRELIGHSVVRTYVQYLCMS